MRDKREMKVVFISLLLVGLVWGAAKPKGKAPPAPKFNCDCGKRNTGRVFGGMKTKRNEYTWMAALEDEDKDHFCGGSVISERHILTAAHCFYDEHDKRSVYPKDMEIVVGGHDLSDLKDANAQRLKVKDIIIHEKYNPTSQHDDIAIVVTSTKITYNTNVGPICMPTEPLKAQLTGQVVKVTGWGLIEKEDTDERVKALRELDLDVVDHRNCHGKGASHICAIRKGEDVCTGDSGGALVWLHPTNHRFTQVGLVSYGLDDECGVVTGPGVYTDVTAYLDWITTKISPLSKESKTCHEIK